MEFDKSKVYTAVNADELKVGSKVIGADTLGILKDKVRLDKESETLQHVRSENFTSRFETLRTHYALAYLVSAPAKLKWTDLKLGDVITNGKLKFMVTAIDSEEQECHIFAGDVWLNDTELKEWEKVENENND